MRYALLIHGEEAAWESLGDEERTAQYAEYGKLAAEMEERGHARGGDELARAATAKLVQVRHGERIVADGPFAETKEQLGGYYLVEARDLNEAIQVAARIPGARLGSVEVRRIRVHDPRAPWAREG
jgi:hypothetical protein